MVGRFWQCKEYYNRCQPHTKSLLQKSYVWVFSLLCNLKKFPRDLSQISSQHKIRYTFSIEVFHLSLIPSAYGELGDGTSYMYVQTSDTYYNIAIMRKKQEQSNKKFQYEPHERRMLLFDAGYNYKWPDVVRLWNWLKNV